jgi:hypothetical protein
MIIVTLLNALITGLLVLNYPETYIFRSWHGTLLTMAILSLSVLINTFFAQKLHLVVHISPAKPAGVRLELTHALGRRCPRPTRRGILLHSHSPLGAFRESFDSGSVDDFL